MNTDIRIAFHIFVALAFIGIGDAFFLRWGAEPAQTAAPKAWMPAQVAQMSQGYRGYGYSPSIYEQRQKLYSSQGGSPYGPVSMDQLLSPIPISVPLQASLTPVSLQHVQLVPCMCPVAAEDADKLHEAAGPGPYLAQPSLSQQPQDQQTSKQ